MNKNLTFSGTDTLVFIILPNTAPIVLGSLTTFSYSSYRIKNPVNTLGGIHIKGVSKGGRVVAGTMIFTMINQHWVKEICELVPWLQQFKDDMFYSDELPLFDLMVVSANEYGKYVSMMIYGVDLTDEAQVLSVNDMYSENTFSFIAREVKPFGNKAVSNKDIEYSSNSFYSEIKFDVFNWNVDDTETTYSKNPNMFTPMTYDEYTKGVQEDLKDYGYDEIEVTGFIDDKTRQAVYDVMDKLNYNEESFEYFFTDILSELDFKFLDDNSYYADGKVDTYIDLPLINNGQYNFGYYNDGDRVIVLGEETVDDKTYYNTPYGWVDQDSISKSNNESSIQDIVLNDVSIKNNINKVIKTDLSIEEFINSLSIHVNSDSQHEYITNASVRDKYRSINSVKKQVVNGTQVIKFTDRIDHVKNNYTGDVVDFVLTGITKDDSAVISVEFVGGSNE